ncbi:tyrosine-type recombinase/integrase [Neptunicoccus cionae]|uniref:tyrosine-type recombinase/integrase n=1 Tax=Neptunicoccus cionae TaxID=2035344 RepID=UPI000C766DEC|nr:site-specific integrase [Amylibacter cionae]PLS20461.1 integrase [Amylibacter cionae]
MRKVVEENERMKRKYVFYLEQAEGLDVKSTDKVLAAILKFEQSTGFKPFKRFHVEQAAKFKITLSQAKNQRGQQLSHSTIDATLALVRKFFHWLAGQTGYKKVLTYSDTRYFNNNRKSARIAHTANEKKAPTPEAAFHAFQAMPSATEYDRRDKALFAFFMLTGARVGAVASLRLKHVDLFHGKVFQDPREVNTKAAKAIDTTFFPVNPAYLECFTAWIEFLRAVKFFDPTDAVFPKAQMGLAETGGFIKTGLSRDPFSTTTPLNKIIRNAFAMVQLPEYTPHAFRTTLVKMANDRCKTVEEFKAWGMNIGHENMAVTMGSYLPIDKHRKEELIKNLKTA